MSRSNAKKMFVEAVNNDLPAEGFSEFLKIKLPEFDNSSMEEEDAIIWEGKLSRHLCSIFALFKGLFPLEIPLRIGQRNAALQGLLLTALEATRQVPAYYDTNLQAAAQTLKEQIESVTEGDDGQVPVDQEFWENIYYQAGELLQALGANPDAIEDSKNIIQAAQVLTDMIMNNFIDAVSVEISVLTNVRSMARWLSAQLGC
jgi:hypothetical protein